MVDKIFFSLLIFIPLALFAYFFSFSPLIVFLFSALSIIPLAKFIGQATDEISSRANPAFGGFLNATLGNAAELIIGLLAINKGLTEVVKASVTGSIIGNLLFVSGVAIFFGGLKFKSQKFNQTAARANATTLFLAVIALTMPAIFYQSAPNVGWQIIDELSIVVAFLMVISYLSSLFFTFKTHKHLYSEEIFRAESNWSVKQSVFVLIVAVLVVSGISEILVGSIEPLVERFGWTELFIGVVFIALIANAAEHFSAVIMALKNKMQVALAISIGSATQIAMFVTPIFVLTSLFLSNPMSLVFNGFELAVMILSVIIANLVVEDGETNWLEGLQLILAYFIIAVSFFFHP